MQRCIAVYDITAYLSNSQKPTHSCPASSMPLRKPPIPANQSMNFILFPHNHHRYHRKKSALHIQTTLHCHNRISRFLLRCRLERTCCICSFRSTLSKLVLLSVFMRRDRRCYSHPPISWHNSLPTSVCPTRPRA